MFHVKHESKISDLKDKIEAAIEIGYPLEIISDLITAPSMVRTNNIMASARHNWDVNTSLYMY